MKPSIKWRGDVVFSSSIYQVVLVTMFAKHCGQEHMLRGAILENKSFMNQSRVFYLCG